VEKHIDDARVPSMSYALYRLPNNNNIYFYFVTGRNSVKH